MKMTSLVIIWLQIPPEKPFENEKTVIFFNESAKWAEENCGKAEIELTHLDLNIYFTDRLERERFTSAVPNYEAWNTSQAVSVINGTAYYFQYIRPSEALCDVE